MYLLDTAILLELRKAKSGQTDHGLSTWAGSVAAQHLFISVLTLIELRNTATRLERKDKNAGLALCVWIDKQLTHAFEGRILPVDESVVATLGLLPTMDMRDGLIAATAKQHGLTIVTRKTASFKASRVKLLNPWGYEANESELESDWRQAARSRPIWLRNLFVRA